MSLPVESLVITVDGQIQGGGGGSAISAPSEPATDSALIYLKGQDGKGAGITIADSANGYNSTAGVQVTRIFSHPIKNLSFCKFDATPTFPDTGTVLPSECSMEVYMNSGIVDNNVIYGETAKDIMGLRFAAGTMQVFTNTWDPIEYFRYDRPALFHVRRVDSGAQSICEVFCDGVKIYETAAFTRLAAGTTGRIIFSGTSLNWSHLRFWTTARTDTEIADAAKLFNPLWGVT